MEHRLKELVAPYLAFKEAGAEVDVVSVKGGKIPLGPTSLAGGALTTHAKKFFDDGGHGVVFDLVTDVDSAAVIAKIWAAGKVSSAVCHGPCGLLEVKTADGEPIEKGSKVTRFSDSEEEAVKKTDKVPFLLETELINKGRLYEKGGDWDVYAVADGKLVTCQNPEVQLK